MKCRTLTLPLMTLLTACVSAGDSSSSLSNTGTGMLQAATAGATYGQLRASYDSNRKFSTRALSSNGPTATLPMSGTATYAGVASFSDDAGPRYIASANLQTNFSNASISGNFSNFRGRDGEIFEGSMTVSNGVVDASDSTVKANINGRLTSDTARVSTVDARGSFDAQFAGDNHEYIRGYTSSTWVTNAGSSTEERHNMTGEIG